MSLVESAVLGLYFLTLLLLALFGAHRYVLVYLYFRHRHRRSLPVAAPAAAPRVTIQLPLYNEMYVVERLLESVACIRHPQDRLEIQVLDDSIDETTARALAAVERLRSRGFDVQYRHRAQRLGFKAGALAEGLRHATGEFVLILDADFVAPADILEKTLGHLQEPAVGMVQVRWGHVNRAYSLLTEVQSILLDGHFVLDHGARSRAGLFFNFNGTAGVWRRAAIEDAGGWQHDTLTEDLDISYRAQLRGWRFVYLQDVVSEAELPVEMNAFKAQQYRWAKGSIETALKLLPRLLAARLPGRVKLEAVFHLTANLAYPLLVLLTLLMFPALVIRHAAGWRGLLLLDVPLLAGATLSVTTYYLASQRELFGRGAWARAAYLPAVLALGVGLSLSNTRAVLQALLGVRSSFARTPKLHVEVAGDDWRRRRYRARASVAPLVELALAGYLTPLAGFALRHGLWGTLPFVLLFQAGFLYASLLSLLQDLKGPRSVLGQEA